VASLEPAPLTHAERVLIRITWHLKPLFTYHSSYDAPDVPVAGIRGYPGDISQAVFACRRRGSWVEQNLRDGSIDEDQHRLASCKLTAKAFHTEQVFA